MNIAIIVASVVTFPAAFTKLRAMGSTFYDSMRTLARGSGSSSRGHSSDGSGSSHRRPRNQRSNEEWDKSHGRYFELRQGIVGEHGPLPLPLPPPLVISKYASPIIRNVGYSGETTDIKAKSYKTQKSWFHISTS
jgi:hypothetical protein